jgi:hypothetical protein
MALSDSLQPHVKARIYDANVVLQRVREAKKDTVRVRRWRILFQVGKGGSSLNGMSTVNAFVERELFPHHRRLRFCRRKQ